MVLTVKGKKSEEVFSEDINTAALYKAIEEHEQRERKYRAFLKAEKKMHIAERTSALIEVFRDVITPGVHVRGIRDNRQRSAKFGGMKGKRTIDQRILDNAVEAASAAQIEKKYINKLSIPKLFLRLQGHGFTGKLSWLKKNYNTFRKRIR